MLMGAFAVLTLIVAVLMLRRARGMERTVSTTAAGPAALVDTPFDSGPEVGLVDTAPPGAGAERHTRWVPLLLAGTGVGLLTGFFGVGGGFAVVPALVLALGFSMPVAVGTSLVVIAVNSAAALLSRLAGGVDIDIPVVVAFTAAAIGASMLGARLAHRTSPRRLTGSFGALLIVVGLYTAYRSLLP
jgi:uncharacterized membrane protein YfcA